MKTQHKWILTSILMLCVILPLSLLRSPEKRLTVLATKASGVSVDTLHGYCWLSDHEILRTCLTQPVSQKSAWVLTRRDITTGQEFPLLSLGKVYNQTGGAGWGQASPDGNHLLWVGYNGMHYQDFCADLSGTGLSCRDLRPHTIQTFWLNNAQWANLSADKAEKNTTALETFQATPPYLTHLTPIVPAIPRWPPGQNRSNVWDAYAIVPHKHLWQTFINPAQRQSICINEIALGPPTRIVQKHTYALPPGAVILADIPPGIDPESGRVAMRLLFYPPRRRNNQPPPRLWQLVRNLLKLDDKPDMTTGIWIGDPVNDSVHEIGHWMTYSYEEHDGGLGGIQWMPSGKQLSFVYRKILYTVPVE